MKPAILRPQAGHDRQVELRYYRKEAGSKVAVRLVIATNAALDQLELDPGVGLPALGKALGIPDLRNWRVTGFPLLWFYFERDDHLDVVRLLGERQDIATIPPSRSRPAVPKLPPAGYARLCKLRCAPFCLVFCSLT